MAQPPTTRSPRKAAAATTPASAKAAEGHSYQAAVQKIAILEAKIAKLDQQIREAEAKLEETKKSLQTKDPQALVKNRIRLLHEYNEIRDVGQGLMGMIAEQRGVRVVDVYKEFEVGEGD